MCHLGLFFPQIQIFLGAGYCCGSVTAFALIHGIATQSELKITDPVTQLRYKLSKWKPVNSWAATTTVCHYYSSTPQNAHHIFQKHLTSFFKWVLGICRCCVVHHGWNKSHGLAGANREQIKPDSAGLDLLKGRNILLGTDKRPSRLESVTRRGKDIPTAQPTLSPRGDLGLV